MEEGTLFDQTKSEWLTPDALAGLGTGIFLREDADVRKTFVPDLTYDGCKEQAEGAIAFKWIPYTHKSHEDLVADNDRRG